MNLSGKNRKPAKAYSFFVSKKLLSIALMVFCTLGTFAQEQEKKQRKRELNPEQIAELQTKKMTLQLELNDKQHNRILEINRKNAFERKRLTEERKALREKSEDLSTDELVQRKSAALDKQIALQREMKNILNEEQFETWKRIRLHKERALKKRKKMHKRMKMYRKIQHRKMRR